ncbi:holo-ACP synthase [Amedibacillus sp. YH-ame10]
MMIGIGCDIVEIKRIAKAMEKEGFLHILTSNELALFQHYKGSRRAEWLAGRFAAKEAIYKAIHKEYPCVISDIEILCDEDGAPVCTFTNCDVSISIAHEHEYAIAYAVAISKE